MAKKQRKVTTLPTQKESFKFTKSLKPSASPAANYGIPKPAVDGDTTALIDSLDNLVKVAPAVNTMLKTKGSEAYLRGDTRPEGLFSLPQQEGFDYTEAQANEGSLYAVQNKSIQELSAKYDGRNPEQFLKDVQKITKQNIQGFTKGKSNAYLAGSQNAIVKVQRDTAVVTQSIIQEKLAKVGLTDIRGITEQKLIEIYQHPAMSRENKAKAGNTVLKEMQKLGMEKYGLDRNSVTNTIFKAILPSGKKNPALFELFYVKDESGIKAKNTPGGEGVEAAYLASLAKQKDNVSMDAYQTLKSMPEFKNADGSFNHVAANKYLDNPDNMESLGLETIPEVNEVKSFISRSNLERQQAEVKAKEEYTTQALNTAFDMVYTSKTPSVTDAISFIKSSEIDGLVKHRVIKGLLTNSKTGDSWKFNKTMTEILDGKITHQSAIYELMGHDTGVTFVEGQKLLTYFKLINSTEVEALKASRLEGIKVLTKGGIQFDSFSSIRQAAAKNFSMDLVTAVDELQKEGKPVDWNKLTGELIIKHTPSFQDELRIMAEGLNVVKEGNETLKAAGGTYISVGVGKNAFKASPGLTTLEAFAADLAARESGRSGKPISQEGLAKTLANTAKRQFLEEAFGLYQSQIQQ